MAKRRIHNQTLYYLLALLVPIGALLLVLLMLAAATQLLRSELTKDRTQPKALAETWQNTFDDYLAPLGSLLGAVAVPAVLLLVLAKILTPMFVGPDTWTRKCFRKPIWLFGTGSIAAACTLTVAVGTVTEVSKPP